MPTSSAQTQTQSLPLPQIVDQSTWKKELACLRTREKSATKQLDSLAAARRRLPMVPIPNFTITQSADPGLSPDPSINTNTNKLRLSDVFDGHTQLIVYSHMWTDTTATEGDEADKWQCHGCGNIVSQFTPAINALRKYDARLVFFAEAPIHTIHTYAQKMGYQVPFYSTLGSGYMRECSAPDLAPDHGADDERTFAVNVFMRDGDKVYRTYSTTKRGTENIQYIFGLLDLLPYGRQEVWQDSPEGWPQSGSMSKWRSAEEISKDAHDAGAR